MKPFISITIISLLILFLFICISPVIQQGETLGKIMGEGIVQSLCKAKYPDCKYFSVPIGNTDDSVEFNEAGKVSVSLAKSSGLFDVTQVHQQRRLYGLKNLIQLTR